MSRVSDHTGSTTLTCFRVQRELLGPPRLLYESYTALNSPEFLESIARARGICMLVLSQLLSGMKSGRKTSMCFGLNACLAACRDERRRFPRKAVQRLSFDGFEPSVGNSGIAC